MKFDCIIMNPPYKRNLHLKILAEAIKHLKDDGTCVNLSPVRWLQDPLAKYKKNCDLKRFESKIIQHIISLDTFDKSKTDQLFNIDTGTLGIYVCSSKENSHRIDEFVRASSNTILDRVIAKIKNNTVDNVEKSLIYDDMDGISCVTSLMVIGFRDREIRMRNGWLTQKPEKLLAKLILASSNQGDLIFDPFAGSGSTAVTAKKLGRHWCTIEKEQRYCAWSEYRLQMAEKDSSIQGYSDGIFHMRNE